MKYASYLVVLIILLVSCSNQASTPDLISKATTEPSETTPNRSATTTSTKVFASSTNGEVIQPTPTPILYNVVLNDTLIGIALKFNITLESLLAANPSIENQPLIVGQVLTIPSPETTAMEASITPVPIQISQVNCFLNKDETLLCLVLVNNIIGDWIQNLSAQISLIDQSGKLLESSTAYSPLDLLAPGKSTILSSLFRTAPAGNYQTQASIISATSLSSPSDRYPIISLHNTLIEVNWDGSSAQVSGKAFLDNNNTESNRVRILAIAFDEDNSVIGFRRWESNENLVPGELMPFEFMVSCLSSEIDHVELTVEAIR